MVARCKPLTKDRLLLKTAFAGTKGWSVVTGFTVGTGRCRKDQNADEKWNAQYDSLSSIRLKFPETHPFNH